MLFFQEFSVGLDLRSMREELWSLRWHFLVVILVIAISLWKVSRERRRPA